MTTRLGRVVTFHEEVPLIKVTWPLNHIVFWYYMTILKHFTVVVTVLMATKFTRVVLEWLLPIILLKPLVTWSCKITWQTKNISTTTVCMSTKLGRMVTNLQQLLPIILLYLWLCVLERSFDKLKTYLHQHDACDHQTWRGVPYHERIPSIKSHDPWITWSCKIMWQTKAIISPLPWCQWLQNLAGVQLTMKGYP